MRYLMYLLFSLCIIGLCFALTMFNVRVTNVERQLTRIEHAYMVVVAENAQLQRINEQNLRLLSDGGWNEGE